MGIDIKIKKKALLKKLGMLTTSIVPVVIIASGSSTSSSPIVSSDQQIVDQLKTKFINKATKLVDADTKYPSALEDNAWTNFEINDLGYELPVIPNGVIVTYNITPNNENGKFIVTAKINKNVATATKTFEVTGFKVASGEKLQALNLIKAFISKDSTLTNKKTLLPSSILGDTRFTMGTNTYYPNKVSLPNNNPYGFKEPTISVPNNMIVKYKINPNDTAGSFIFEVEVYKVKTYEDCGWFSCNTIFNGTETLAKGRFKLTGFKTQLEHDQEFLNAIKITKDMLEYKESKAVLPSALTKPKKLTDENGMILEYEEWLQNDEKGTINWKIVFRRGDAKRALSGQITGFKTNLDIIKETIKTLGNDALNALKDSTTLPSSVTSKSKVLSELKKITAIASLSQKQRDLIVEDFIALNYDNENGELLVVISKDELSKTITVTGFQTTSQANALAMKDFVANLQELDFASLKNSSTIATSISSANVFEKIQSLNKFNSLDELVKKLLKETDVESSGDDSKGELTIRIINHGPQNNIKLLGFKKHSDENKKFIKDFISGLNKTFLNSLANGTKWVNQVTKDDVLSAIRATSDYSNLTPDQQKIIATNIFVISQDVEGELKVSFIYDDLSIEIKKSGFKTNAKVVEDQIQALSTTALDALSNPNALASTIKSKTDVLAAIKKILTIASVTSEQKDLIKEGDITLMHNDVEGNLVVKISNHGTVKEITIVGFKTNAKVVEEQIQALNANALDALSNPNALASTIKSKTDVLAAIKGIVTINSMTKVQKDLIKESDINLIHNDVEGNLVVTISNHGPPKEITIVGFTTNAKVVEDQIQALSTIALDTLRNSDALASTITSKTNVLAAIKKISTIASMTLEQKNLIKEKDITLNPNDTEGKLIVTISNHGSPKEIIISGFKTNARVVEDQIQALSPTALDTLRNSDALASTIILKSNVLTKIKSISTIASMSIAQKSLIKENDITLNPNDTEGKLVVTISNHGVPKEITIFGFKTNAKVVEEAIQAITKVMFENLTLEKPSNIKRLPSQVTIHMVKDVILFHWNQPPSFLNEAQKGLLEDLDIKILPNNENGTLKITISNHGNDKVLTISGFKTTKEYYQGILDGIKKGGSNFLPTFTKNLLPSEVPKPINGKTPRGVIYTYENWNANDETGQISYEIHLGKGSSKVSSTVIVFNFQTRAYRTKIEKIASAIKSLGDDSFDNLNDVSKLPSEVEKTSVFSQWKLASTSLSNDEKMLMTSNMLALIPNDQLGTLVVEIRAFGAKKDITLTKFLTTFKKQAIVDVKATGASDLNLLTIDTNLLPSEVAKPSDDVTSKGVAYTYESWIQNNVDGKIDYVASLSKAGFTKKLLGSITNFKTNAKLVAERLASLENSIFDEFKDATVLASTITSKTQFLNKIKTHPIIQNLSEAQRNLIDETIISINYDDALGKLTITINILPTAKIIELGGFLTNAKLVAQLVEKIIHSLTSASFTRLTQNGHKFPSEFQSSDVNTYLKGTGNALGDLNPSSKDLLETNQIALSFNDDYGILTITINGHGTQKIVNASGFKSNLGIIAKIIENLDANTFAFLNNRGQRFASEVKASEIVTHLKKDGQALSSLADSQKALFTTGAIKLVSNNDSGILTIAINVNGQAKVLNVGNFKNNYQVTLNKVASAILGLDDNSLDILSNDEVLASSISVDSVAKELKKLLTSLDTLQKLLISSSNISLDPNDDTGSLKVTVNFNAKSKEFVVSGFLTTAKQNDRNDIESVSVTDLNLPTSSKVLSTTIVKPADATTTSGVSYAYTTWTPNDNLGEIRWMVSLNKGVGEEKSLEGVISGFKTNNVVAIEEFIKNLDGTIFEGLSNPNKLANQITRVDVLSFLLRVADTKKITSEQQKLLSTKNIVLAPNNKKGQLELTIKNYGETKKFKIGDFKVEKALNTQKQITKPKPKKPSFESLSILAKVMIFGGATIGMLLIGLVFFFYFRKSKKLKKGKK